MTSAFDKAALKELLADDPGVNKPEHQRLALAMLNVLNASSGFNQKKRWRLLIQIVEALPYPERQPRNLEKKLKAFALTYYCSTPKDLEKEVKQLEDAKLEYLLNLLKKEKQILFRRLKRQVKLEVKTWDSSGKPPASYRYSNFENMLDDLSKAVHVINAEANALRHSQKKGSKRIKNKEKRWEFFDKIVDVWPKEYKMTKDKFSALWEKYKKSTPNPWKGPKREKSPSPQVVSPINNKVDSSKKEVVPMMTALSSIPSENGVSRKRPICISPKENSPKRAKIESEPDIVEITSTIPQTTSFYEKPVSDPWADWRFSIMPAET